MEFWKVAAAVLMFKSLDLLYAYAFSVMGDFNLAALSLITLVWLVVCAIIWIVLGCVFGGLWADFRRDWTDRG